MKRILAFLSALLFAPSKGIELLNQKAQELEKIDYQAKGKQNFKSSVPSKPKPTR
jgi:gas vesicle protein